MTKQEAVVELLKPMMAHIAESYRLADEPEKAAEKIARFVVSFAKGIEGVFEATE